MRIGHTITKSESWNNFKETVMEEVLKKKLETCQQYREALIQSGAAKLEENTQHPFWGGGTKDQPGLHKLGALHMKIRAVINKTVTTIAAVSQSTTAFTVNKTTAATVNKTTAATINKTVTAAEVNKTTLIQ